MSQQASPTPLAAAVVSAGFIDVSLPPPGSALRRTLRIAGDVALAIVLVLAMPIILVVGAIPALALWLGVVITQRIKRGRRS